MHWKLSRLVPTVTWTQQTAYSVRAQGASIFSVTATDEDTHTLRFEWQASAGTLATPVGSPAGSEVDPAVPNSLHGSGAESCA
jgi:hypothetical protein